MLEESKDLIIKNFVTLMKECDVDVLKELLIKKGVFSKSEIEEIFLSEDERHNKRIFFFNLQKKEQKAFHILIEALKETNQHNISKLLSPQVTGCHPYHLPTEYNIRVPESLSIHVNSDKEPLNVKVIESTQFLDTRDHNKKVEFYSSRSKNRGKVLVINNYKYANEEKYPYRNGAKVDNTNLQKLFNQMGGWEVYQHVNKTNEEMIHIIDIFAKDEENKKYDICFVIIMGHGKEKYNKTVIYGVDGRYIFVKDIQKHFTNDNCIGFRGKPKVFLFQACRGRALDLTVTHTETDSTQRSHPSSEYQEVVMNSHIRTQEDVLIGYATLLGYKAHRDTDCGSWYIELICKNFMNYASIHHVSTLLQLVDQDLRRRMSEVYSMQTAEYRNKGFKNLYLNPGIYYEDGVLKHFHNQTRE